LNSSITLISHIFECLPMLHSGFLVEIGVPTPQRCPRAPAPSFEAAETKARAITSPDQRLLPLPPTANGELSADDSISWSGPTVAKLFAALSPRRFLNGLSPLRAPNTATLTLNIASLGPLEFDNERTSSPFVYVQRGVPGLHRSVSAVSSQPSPRGRHAPWCI
jgi:hypothetical protein